MSGRINESHVGWWCPLDRAPTFDELAADGCHTCEKCVPVFTPLAVPEESTETRADMEEHAEVVKASYPRGDDIYAPSDSEHTHKRTGSSNSAGSSDWRIGCDVVNGFGTGIDDDVTEADAVLWVVEGRLP